MLLKNVEARKLSAFFYFLLAAARKCLAHMVTGKTFSLYVCLEICLSSVLWMLEEEDMNSNRNSAALPLPQTTIILHTCFAVFVLCAAELPVVFRTRLRVTAPSCLIRLPDNEGKHII